jgi:hypothetical protein
MCVNRKGTPLRYLEQFGRKFYIFRDFVTFYNQIIMEGIVM